MSTRPMNPDRPEDVKRFLRSLKKRHDALALRLEAFMEELEELAYYIQTLEDNPKAFIALLLQGRDRRLPRPPGFEGLSPAWAKKLKRGVQSLQFLPGPDGYNLVLIDRHPPFLLPKRLASLLDILGADLSPSLDHLVGWKKKEEIALRLNKVQEKHTLPGSIPNLVYRLRSALARLANLDHRFVEVDRKRGVRFRRRRPG